MFRNRNPKNPQLLFKVNDVFLFILSANEIFKTEHIKQSILQSGVALSANIRRSRKIELEFPDGDLILTSTDETSDRDTVKRRKWSDGPCECWNTTSDNKQRQEVECSCSNSNFTQIHGAATIPFDVHTL